MKKLFLTLSVGVLATASLLAQGRINFTNTSATPLRISNGTITNVIGTASTAMFGIGPASMRIQLFAGLSSASLSPVLIGSAANRTSVTNSASTSATFQGTFNGGNPLPLVGYDGSQSVFLMFTAVAINGTYYGSSPIISVVPSISPATATTVFSTTADGSHWDGLIIILPEPTSGSLLVLGAGILGGFRSRKRLKN